MARRVFGVRETVMAVAFAWCMPLHAADRLLVSGVPGQPGGGVVAALRSEPRTLNWVVASDAGSREVLGLLMADLIHINRETQKTEPALAKSWTVSPDGQHWTLELRRGVEFSDGRPFTADDVVFTFQVIYDERSQSPQRDLLLLNGRPIAVRKLDPWRVAFDLPEARAVADRLFDGIYILPRHLLESAWKAGKVADTWTLATPPAEIAGLGPFRLKSYTAGQQIVLERNPHYWKVDSAGHVLPYLDTVHFLPVGSEDNQVLRFQAGDTDIISRVGPRNYGVLEKEQARRGYQMQDLGASLEATFLVFNLGDSGGDREIAARQSFLKRKSFRLAVSAAIDRASMVKLVYGGRANPLAGLVAPGNRAWIDTRLTPPVRSLDRARQLLTAEGFQWKNGALFDPSGQSVEFSLLVSNTNTERQQVAALIQDDLKPLGIRINITPVDSRSLGSMVQKTRRFEAALMAFATADADPNPDLAVYLSDGGNHLWNPNQTQPATPWEAEIDSLMRRQQVTLKYNERRRLFDRVQQIMAENQPMIALVSPNILVGAKKGLRNFRPAMLDPYTTWNLDQMYWSHTTPAGAVR
jgi:peptide/nickel transport system substrate-binding protein